jgi:hypothetical protein
MSIVRVAVYERTIRASLERIWENVLDWEHLPWLHATTFGHIRVHSASQDGWRAEASLRQDGVPFEIDVALDRPAHCYHSRTVSGPSAGTDIVTTLDPVAAHATGIRVEFLVPGVPEHLTETIGAAYVAVYTRLWDEDEAMMLRRQALLDGRLVEPSREVVLDGACRRVSTVCPHLGGPLADAPIQDGCVVCPWHGYRVDLRTGRVTPP